MASKVNLRGGEWGRMEAYVRRMLTGRNMSAYMVTKPDYTGSTAQGRPRRIHVSVYFSVSPFKVKFTIDCA
jgi:hypothetical protein